MKVAITIPGNITIESEELKFSKITAANKSTGNSYSVP